MSNALEDGSPQPVPCDTPHDRRAEHIRIEPVTNLARATCTDCGLTYHYYAPGEAIEPVTEPITEE